MLFTRCSPVLWWCWFNLCSVASTSQSASPRPWEQGAMLHKLSVWSVWCHRVHIICINSRVRKYSKYMYSGFVVVVAFFDCVPCGCSAICIFRFLHLANDDHLIKIDCVRMYWGGDVRAAAAAATACCCCWHPTAVVTMARILHRHRLRKQSQHTSDSRMLSSTHHPSILSLSLYLQLRIVRSVCGSQ